MRLTFVASGFMLAACAQPVPPPSSSPLLVAAQTPPTTSAGPATEMPPRIAQSNARASRCEAVVRAGRHFAGQGAVMSFSTSDDGWCRRGLNYEGHAFSGGNVVDVPSHGQARVRHAGFRTYIEYRSEPGYVGDDRFSVTLTPGNGTYLVSVAVHP